MQLFLTGKEIFHPEGIWMVNQIRESKIKFGLTNAPQVSADPKKMVNWSSSHQFVLLKQAKRNTAKTKATLKFINWVRTHSIHWAEAGQNPASQAITKNKAYQKMGQSFLLSRFPIKRFSKLLSGAQGYTSPFSLIFNSFLPG